MRCSGICYCIPHTQTNEHINVLHRKVHNLGSVHYILWSQIFTVSHQQEAAGVFYPNTGTSSQLGTEMMWPHCVFTCSSVCVCLPAGVWAAWWLGSSTASSTTLMLWLCITSCSMLKISSAREHLKAKIPENKNLILELITDKFPTKKTRTKIRRVLQYF